MFTGLIESIGRVTDVRPSSAGLRFRVETSLAPELHPGDSVAVNGVCLTVVAIDGKQVLTDISPETSRVTTLGTLLVGAVVNLERPLRADSRLGGHFVQGHVDATGAIDAIRAEGESYRITLTFPASLERWIVPKGSIAIDGISLTVAAIDGARLDVQIIPYTWDHTNLHAAQPGARVNLEADILGKYAVRAIDLRSAG
jgi:riboflavin synthase alpha subunit